jgi:hypothetical protein
MAGCYNLYEGGENESATLDALGIYQMLELMRKSLRRLVISF